MRLMIFATLASVTLSIAAAVAQTPPAPPATSGVPAANAPSSAVPASPTGKRMACRQSVQAKGVRGQEQRDQMQLCMAEGQLDCVRQAIAQKTAGPQRKEFMKSCMGPKIGGDRS